MGTEWLVTSVAAAASILTYVAKKITDHLAGKGRLRVDEAAKIRNELRGEIDRRDARIGALERRLSTLEEDLEKAERERDALILRQERYKLDVYRTLVDAGADKNLLNAVLAIQ